jgi:hypothetical protein
MGLRSCFAAVTVAVVTSVPGVVAGAAQTETQTVAVDIEARCETLPHIPGGPDGPVFRQFHLVVTTPRRVARRHDATVSASVDYSVSSLAQIGGIAIEAIQSGISTLHFIIVPPSSPSIEGSVAVPVTAAPGRHIEWVVAYFGQSATFGGLTISDTCVPTTPIHLPSTRITG